MLSDLHLGPAGSSQNDFRFSDGAFAAALRRLAETHDWVILNGDIFELWEPALGCLPQTEELFRKICQSWPEITAVINGIPNIIPLSGNHDSAIHLRGWLPKARAEVLIPELSLFVAHGHQGDRRWCADDSPCLGFVRCLACCVGYGEQLADPDFDDSVARVENLADSKTEDVLDDYAFAVAERLGVNVVCLGHTHRAKMLSRGIKIYANCGKCVGGEFQLVVVQGVATAVEVSLCKATLDGPVLGLAEQARLSSVAAISALPGFGGPLSTQLSSGSLVVVGSRVITRPGSFLAGL